MPTKTPPIRTTIPMALIKAELPEWAEGLAEPHRFKAIYGGRGSGKALDAGTPIATPDGWTRLGDLRVGDEVFDESGHPVRVTGVFPQGKRPAFAVRFADDAELIADADHLWVTTTREQLFVWDASAVPVTTALIARTIDLNHTVEGPSGKHMIKSVEPLGEDREMVCISVNSPHSLYLAGKEMIPTHNSWGVSGMLILMGTQRPLRIACVREVQSSITESSKQALDSWINRLGLGNFYRVQKFAINASNGTYIFFQGLSGATEESIKSWENIDIVWFEEAQRMSVRSREILYPTIRKPGSELWFTFNPRYRSDPVYQDFVLGGIKDAFVQHVNYNMNPWFPDELEQERLRCLEMEPGRYSHIWLGDLDDAGEERHVLPFGMLEKCVGAHEKVGYKPSGRIQAGLDVADTGVDNNALVLRRGPLIMSVDTWSALTLGETARRAHGICSERSVSRLYYDASGIGGGVRSHLHELGNKPYYADPVLFGGAVLGPKREYSYRVQNSDFFARRNAQLGWALRLRAQRTEQLLNGENIDPDRCLFIDPRIPGLEMYLNEMTQPLWRENNSGKLEIDKMGRSDKSPDRYDATALAFAWDSRAGLRALTGVSRGNED